MSLYDQIGRQYRNTRHPDPRITAAILSALGDARRLVNVGAGTGSYEPTDRRVVAVEPSWRMIAQRPKAAAPVVQAAAEALPFSSRTFDAALAVLTMHHWSDWRTGLSEMQRVAERLVLLTFDPGATGTFWLTDRYFPEIVALDRAMCPSLDQVREHVGPCTIDHVPVPHDCLDGFLAAYWRRPEAYLDPAVRAGISSFALLDPQVVARGLAHLGTDLTSGEWERCFGHLRTFESLDVCYRLIVSS